MLKKGNFCRRKGALASAFSLKSFLQKFAVAFSTLALCAVGANPSFDLSQFHAQLTSSSFVSKDFQTQGSYQFGWLGNFGNNSTSYSADLNSVLSLGIGCVSCSFFEISNAQFEKGIVRGQNQFLRVGIGRKHLRWASIDDQWNLGLLNPRFRNDEIQPMQSGLVGSWLRYGDERFSAEFFASGLYIPERGASISTDNGNLRSDSPWFVEPPRELVFLDQSTPLKYYPQIPPASKIVQQPSLGLATSALLWHGASLKVFAIDKPLNQLALSYSAYLDLSNLSATVELYPRVLRHTLVGAELSQTIAQSRIAISVIQEKLREVLQDLPRGSTEQIFAPANLFSIDLSQRATFSNAMNVELGAHALYIQKENDIDRGSFVEGDTVSIFPDRFLFRSAMMFEFKLSIPLALQRDSANFKVSYTRDLKYESEMMSLVSEYVLGKNYFFALQGDFLAAKKEQDGFVGQFRSNDRVTGSLKYVF